MQILRFVILVLGLVQFSLGWEDPFKNYLTSLPTLKTVLSEENSGSGSTAIVTKKFTFSSKGGVNTVYGYIVRPQAAGTYPGLLILHGGGQNAEGYLPMAVDYASRGYVVVATDLPGICGTDNTPNSLGPWKSAPSGEGPRLDVAAGPETSVLVDAGVAGLEGFNFLRSQTNVLPGSIGIFGLSWGGYATTLLSGLLGDKVKAAYAVYGCGFFDKGTFFTAYLNTLSDSVRQVWLTHLDAGRRAGNISAPFFIEGASNDAFFWPEAVEATLQAIPGISNHVWGPNLNHQRPSTATTMTRTYFDYYLKGVGSAFGTIKVTNITTETSGSKTVTIAAKVSGGIVLDTVQLYYSEQKVDWQSRNWISIKAGVGVSGTYTITIPANLANKNMNFFVNATDKRGVITSSAMYDDASIVVGIEESELRRKRPATKIVSGSIYDARGRSFIAPHFEFLTKLSFRRAAVDARIR